MDRKEERRRPNKQEQTLTNWQKRTNKEEWMRKKELIGKMNWKKRWKNNEYKKTTKMIEREI